MLTPFATVFNYQLPKVAIHCFGYAVTVLHCRHPPTLRLPRDLLHPIGTEDASPVSTQDVPSVTKEDTSSVATADMSLVCTRGHVVCWDRRQVAWGSRGYLFCFSRRHAFFFNRTSSASTDDMASVEKEDLCWNKRYVNFSNRRLAFSNCHKTDTWQLRCSIKGLWCALAGLAELLHLH